MQIYGAVLLQSFCAVLPLSYRTFRVHGRGDGMDRGDPGVPGRKYRFIERDGSDYRHTSLKKGMY